MSLPEFITFTGVDDRADLGALRALDEEYEIEVGVLFSPVRQGNGRYPSWSRIDEVLEMGMICSAHLCGGFSRAMLENELPPELATRLNEFARIQVNTTAVLSQQTVRMLAELVAPKSLVLQYRGMDCPPDREASWLFDASGGRGIEPNDWPRPGRRDDQRLRGYAGGLRPTNVAMHVDAIGRHDSLYWIDMETGVRDHADRFDVIACRRVCELVYGRSV